MSENNSEFIITEIGFKWGESDSESTPKIQKRVQLSILHHPFDTHQLGHGGNMVKSGDNFARLLTEGVYQISFRESKTIRVIQDELGYALNKKGGASIEYWRKGHIPAKLSDIETLAHRLLERAQLDRNWLEDFLTSAGHPAARQIRDQLFPPAMPTQTSRSNFDRQSPTLTTLPLQNIPNPAPLPPGSLMPLSKNPLFVGREHNLRDLAAALNSTGVTTISQVETAAATGLGGIGKTQLACEFVHRYGQFFKGGIFWLSFADPQAIPAEIAACGRAGNLGLQPDFDSRPLREQVRLVQAAWQQPVPRLLIFDNCEEPALLTRWRPTSGGCRVLVTSRRGDWEMALGVKPLALGVLSRPESLSLLHQHCPHADQGILDQIAEELGDLPLALHLAASYLHRYRRVVSPAHYLEQLRNPTLLHHPSLSTAGISPTGHIQHVGRTFALSYDRLDPAVENDALALALLVRAAHFAPGEPIWYNLLVQTLGLAQNDPDADIKADRAFARLIELGLIETEQDHILRMHRLVAAFVRDVAADAVATTQQAVEAVVFEETARINQAGYPMPLLAWQLHLRSVVDVAQAREDERSAGLCTELGQHLWQVGDYEGAFPYFEKALTIRRRVLGEQHLDTVQSLNHVGYLLHSQGRLAEARPYFEKALTIRQKLLGTKHPAIAESLNYLGQWHLVQKDLPLAESHFQQALAISVNTLGKTHPLTAEYANNLGWSLIEQGNLEAALPHLKRALAINQKALGPDHPDTAMNLNNLAGLLKRMNRLAEAQPYFEQALAIRRQVLGEEHPDTGQSYSNLGGLLLEQGNFAEARPYLEQALAVYNSAYTEPHPRVAFCLDRLGLVLQAQGDLAGAGGCFEQALAIRQETLRKNHPLKAHSFRNLGLLLAAQGDVAGARHQLEQARSIFEASLGPEHPDTQATVDNLAALPGSG